MEPGVGEEWARQMVVLKQQGMWTRRGQVIEERSDGLSSGGLKLIMSSVPKHLIKVPIGGITMCMWLWSPSAVPATRANTSNKQEDRSHSFKRRRIPSPNQKLKQASSE